ncbi:MAG: hypothetical protein GF331_12910 [Chitinivibrionales bacterium]|nr:hypothetical protein [Chitinivibrionales bacterium]
MIGNKAMTVIVLAALVLGSGCRDTKNDREPPTGPLTCEVNVGPVEEVLGTAVPLAYAATLAMAAMAGSNLPCVAVTASCASPPCSGSVTVSLDEACVLPLGYVGNGTIVVAGNWTSENEATLTAVYQGVAIDGQELFVRQGAFAALASNDTITVTYADQNVEVTSATDAEIAQSAWSIAVATNGTLGDTDDDVMLITGLRQYASTSSVGNIALTAVRMDASCPANPTDGEATIYEVGGGTSPATVLSFHSACDAEVDVNATLCLQYIGDSVPIDLLN